MGLGYIEAHFDIGVIDARQALDRSSIVGTFVVVTESIRVRVCVLK